MHTFHIGTKPVSIADVVAIARNGSLVAVEAAVTDRLSRARDVVERVAQGDQPIYGLTSALGANTGKVVAPIDRALYQVQAVRARAVGVGPSMPEDRVRAAMFARVAGMAQGGSGVSIDVFRSLVDALNHRVFPCVPAWGSISVADMPPLSHIALALIGEGEAFVGGRRVSGAAALAHAGLAPVTLAGKDGLALFSANAVTVGAASLVLNDLAAMFDRLDDIAALSFEGFRGNVSPLDARAQKARAAPGQAEAAARLRAALAGSGLFAPNAARRVQDPLSFRCVAQVHGAALDALARAVAARRNRAQRRRRQSAGRRRERCDVLDREFPHTRASPSPTRRSASRSSRSPRLIVERCIHLMAPAIVGPAAATDAARPAAIRLRDRAENADGAAERPAPPRQLGVPRFPAGVGRHRRPCADGVEMRDQARRDARTASPISRRSRRSSRRRRSTFAIPTCGATLGQGARRMYEGVRSRVEFLDDDRPLGPDFEAMASWLVTGDSLPPSSPASTSSSAS